MVAEHFALRRSLRRPRPRARRGLSESRGRIPASLRLGVAAQLRVWYRRCQSAATTESRAQHTPLLRHSAIRSASAITLPPCAPTIVIASILRDGESLHTAAKDDTWVGAASGVVEFTNAAQESVLRYDTRSSDGRNDWLTDLSFRLTE